MKVLFLDIDGVVNNLYTLQRSRGMYGIDPVLAERVKHIIAETGCEVVLSSTWRLDGRSRAEVQKQVCLFIGVTPDFNGTTDRGHEVAAWLKEHPEVTKYAILDDNADFHKDQPLFKTSWSAGLTDEIAQDVINHFGALNGTTI